MKAAILAVQFMTRLPLPAVEASEAHFAKAIRWFPLAGVVVGACVAGAGWLGSLRDPALGALLALTAWVGVTGALHLDGLADIVDATGASHRTPERLRQVLAEPHVGSFGAAAIAFQLLAKLVLLWLAVRAGSYFALALVPPLARIGPLVWARFLPPLHEGFGTLFRRGATVSAMALWLFAWSLLALAAAPSLLASLPVLALWPLWLRMRIGGISGDGHGAGIELVETCALLAMVVVA